MQRNLTVSYKTETRGGSRPYSPTTYIEVPALSLKGKWLEDLGFEIGTKGFARRVRFFELRRAGLGLRFEGGDGSAGGFKVALRIIRFLLRFLELFRVAEVGLLDVSVDVVLVVSAELCAETSCFVVHNGPPDGIPVWVYCSTESRKNQPFATDSSRYP